MHSLHIKKKSLFICWKMHDKTEQAVEMLSGAHRFVSHILAGDFDLAQTWTCFWVQ